MMMMMILIIIIIILLPQGYIWARSKSFLEWLLILPSSKDTKDDQNPLFFLGDDLQMARLFRSYVGLPGGYPSWICFIGISLACNPEIMQ